MNKSKESLQVFTPSLTTVCRRCASLAGLFKLLSPHTSAYSSSRI